MVSFDEEKCLKGLYRGDVGSYELLFRHYFPKGKSFINSLLQDSDTAEDLAQDVFVKIWNKRESVLQIQNFSAYLFRMSRNEVFQYLRRAQLVKMHGDEDHEEVAERSERYDVIHTIYAQELEEIIDHIVNNMPQQRRKIYLLSRRDLKNNAEIAEELNISKHSLFYTPRYSYL